MQLFGRLTADAVVKTVKDDRKVVQFSIAINDSYRVKGSSERTKITTYVNCAYWMGESIARNLAKGLLVELTGRISVNAWINLQGEARATINFHVNEIKLHGKGSQAASTDTVPAVESKEPVEDLPF